MNEGDHSMRQANGGRQSREEAETAHLPDAARPFRFFSNPATLRLTERSP